MSSSGKSVPSPAWNAANAAVAGHLHDQRACKLLTVAGELRNTIYDLIFDDGKKANLNFLLTCRQVYLECARLGFSSIAIQIGPIVEQNHAFIFWPNPTHLEGPVTIPHLEMINTVHCRLDTDSHDIPLRVCHALGLRPTAFVHDIHPWTRAPWPNADIPALNDPIFFELCSTMALNHQKSAEFDREIDRHYNNICGTMFAQFILNHRLKTWTAKHYTRDGAVDREFIMTCENREGFTKEIGKVRLTWRADTAEEWLDKLVLLRRENRGDARLGDAEFLALVGHEDLETGRTGVFAELRVAWIRHGQCDG